CGQTTNIPWTF
nr:immunoglobulin light chain junction region [Macaca mulatta]MOW14788.1 immunoglobulin light chain junction region [Macaca mulatta]